MCGERCSGCRVRARGKIKMMLFIGTDLGVLAICVKREVGFLRIHSAFSALFFWMW